MSKLNLKLLIVVLFFIAAQISYAQDDILLSVVENETAPVMLEAESNILGAETLTKENESKILDLFRQGYEFENSIIKNVKLGFCYEGYVNWDMTRHDTLHTKYRMPLIETYINTKFRDNKTEFTFRYNFNRRISGFDNYFSERISEVFVTRHINENQKILIGQGPRLPIGIEGSSGTYSLDMLQRTQIARTFANIASVGIRNLGNYKYIDYDIGVYDATRFFQDFGQGYELASWVNLKPLANLDTEKYGKLKLGTGLDVGDYKKSYTVWGAFAGYDYKKLHTKFEYANANGYNGAVNSGKEADGYYATAIYDLTNKLHLIARYDVLNPDKSLSNAVIKEYGAGLTYDVKKNVKILLNYFYRDNHKDSKQNMIMLGLRFVI